jgi:hypothetical protein
MKKTYIRPEAQVVNIHTEGMIAASLQMHSDKSVDTSAGGQLTNKKDPIWGTEEEETESFW